MITFLTILFWIFFSFWVLGLFVRYLLPYLLTRFIKRKMADFQKQQQAYYQYDQPKEDVTVEGAPQKGKKFDRNDGEYVDFEEVK